MVSFPRRVGLTQIDVLVVLAILGVLVALLLPAVQKVRTAANQAACLNNLKQIGLALGQYEEEYRSLPASGYFAPQPMGNSWAAYLLPWIEQGDLYGTMNFDQPVTDPVNVAAIRRPVKTYQCPSAPVPRTAEFSVSPEVDVVPLGTARLAVTDYAPVFGTSRDLAPYLPPGTPVGFTGTLLLNRSFRAAEITDGASNTILVGEDAGRPQRWINGSVVSTPNTISPAPGGAWGDPVNGFTLHRTWGAGGSCMVNCDNLWGLYGFHPAGAGVAMADGSAHFVAPGSTLVMLAALVSRAGGEAVELPW